MSEAASNIPQFISPESAAAKLGVSVHTVYRLLRKDAIPSSRVGRRLVIAEPDLLAYLHGEMAQVYQLREAE